MGTARETEVFLVMINQEDGSTPDAFMARAPNVPNVIFDRADAMEAHRKAVKAYGPYYGVYKGTLSVGPRIDLEDELDPDRLNEWQRLVLEEYPARGSILSQVRTVEDMAKVIRAGLAGDDSHLVNLVVELNEATTPAEAAQIIEFHADLAYRASQGTSRPDDVHFGTVKRVLESLLDVLRPQDGLAI